MTHITITIYTRNGKQTIALTTDKEKRQREKELLKGLRARARARDLEEARGISEALVGLSTYETEKTIGRFFRRILEDEAKHNK